MKGRSEHVMTGCNVWAAGVINPNPSVAEPQQAGQQP